MKYSYLEGDLIKAKTDEETIAVAYALASGVFYAQYDIDPFEAGFLIGIVRDYAVEKSDGQLQQSCNRSLSALRPFIDAFAVVVDAGW